jgi:hypothetical protein
MLSLDGNSPIGRPIGSVGCALVRETGPSNCVAGWAGIGGFGGNGAMYHAPSRSIYWMEPAVAGSKIRRLAIPGDPVKDSWRNAWSELSPNGGPQASSANGIYSKFNMVEIGSEAALVCVTSIDGPVHVYKLPA